MFINMIGFNVAWFGLIYFGNTFVPVALLMLVVHFIWISKVKNEIWLALIITIIGVTVDSLLQLNRVFIFPNPAHIPFWLVAIWACFATTICHSFSFLSAYKPLQILLGLIMAPLSYKSGELLGAVEFGFSFTQTYIVLGCIWAILFSTFFFLKAQLIKEDTRYA
jgi:hypothetical protein